MIGEVRPSPRILAWDSGYDFAPALQMHPVRSLHELAELVRVDVRTPDQVPQRIAWVGPITRDHFVIFCKLAFVWMRAHPNGVLLVDELSDVTSPGKATPGWGELVRKHRKFRRGHVYGMTQRPAESDKTIVGNATVLHSGRFNFDSDEEYMARCLKVPLEELQALPDFQYIERNMRTKVISRGAVRL